MALPSNRAPKQRVLTRNETRSSLDSWWHNLVYIFKQIPEFLPFVTANWQRLTRQNPNRGFTDDAVLLDADGHVVGRTAVQKSAIVEDMLGMVANHCDIIARRSLLESTSLSDVLHKIRLHFNFQNAGSRFLDLAKLKPEPEDTPEDLY